MKEIGYLDRNRVRTEEEIELLRKLRREKARTDCLLVGNILSWLLSVALAVVLVLAVNL